MPYSKNLKCDNCHKPINQGFVHKVCPVDIDIPFKETRKYAKYYPPYIQAKDTEAGRVFKTTEQIRPETWAKIRASLIIHAGA